MSGLINELLGSKQAVASELFSSGICNLRCKYCYIPKTSFLKEVNDEVIKSIRSGLFIERLKLFFGDELKTISHWGTEPTLTINEFKDFYKTAIQVFPSLESINLSSNFITNPENLLKFVVDDLPSEKKLKITIQVSIDGPKEITDKNRGEGSTDKIVNHLLWFSKKVDGASIKHEVKMHVKPTIDYKDIERLSIRENLFEYYHFFDQLFSRWDEANFNKKIEIQKACNPTFVFPGDYTKEDGVNFFHLMLGQEALKSFAWKSILKPECFYFGKFREKYPFYREFYTKHRMFTCSAGDSNIGMGMNGNLHLCHATFFMESKKYEQETEKYTEYAPICNGVAKGAVGLVRENYIAAPDNVTKFLFRSRCFHDSSFLRFSSDIATTLELAKIGDINPCYKNIEMAKLLSMFPVVLIDCPVDDISLTGSIFVQGASFQRLFGNGVFEYFLKSFLRGAHGKGI